MLLAIVVVDTTVVISSILKFRTLRMQKNEVT